MNATYNEFARYNVGYSGNAVTARACPVTLLERKMKHAINPRKDRIRFSYPVALRIQPRELKAIGRGVLFVRLALECELIMKGDI
jgi:hypothetical protein